VPSWPTDPPLLAAVLCVTNSTSTALTVIPVRFLYKARSVEWYLFLFLLKGADINALQNANKQDLKNALFKLPAPKNEYQISVPQTPDMEETDTQLEDDATDVMERQEREARERGNTCF
jgi:hypothetical protein